MLSLQAVTYDIDDRPLFKPISLKLRAGSLLIIHGPNGVGKSTFLKCVAELLACQGLVKWQSQASNQSHDYKSSRIYLGHKLGLKAGLTVTDNLSFSLGLLGHPQSASNIDRACARLALPSKTRIEVLSAGQRQRVALARLLLHPAKLWLLDEPMTSLDREGQALFQTVLDEHLQAGGMGLIASHHAMAGYEHIHLRPG